MLTEKELKKLNRYQLLELLIIQTERADKLQICLENAESKLKEQEIKISSLGSIAEASLQVSGIFESAQHSADIYLSAAKNKAEEIEEEARKKAEQILAQAQEDASRIKGE